MTIEYAGQPKPCHIIQEVQQFSRLRYHLEYRPIKWSPFNQSSILANTNTDLSSCCQLCFIPLSPLLNQSPFDLFVFFFFCSLALFCISHPLSSIRPLFYVAEEQLSRAGHEVSQAGWLQALQSPDTEFIVSLARIRTHPRTNAVTSIHVHLKARQEGVGS